MNSIPGHPSANSHPGIKRVGVLLGGISPEHPVSVISGCSMLAQLNPDKWLGFPILITLQNEWLWPRVLPKQTLAPTPSQVEAWMANPPADWERHAFPAFHALPDCDIFLLGLHGIGGEDGRLQGLLEMARRPYTGSGSLGSALSMDKVASKHVYRAMGIPTAPYVVLTRDLWNTQGVQLVEQNLGPYPVVVKHPKGGSSIGVAIAHHAEELLKALRDLGTETDVLLVEAFIKGRESTCGYLEGGPLLPPTEIMPVKDAFFNFEAKYQSGRTREITPATFGEAINARIQELAAKAHRALRLETYSRTDIMVVGEGENPELFVLETNNLPGFTPMSILPQQAKATGLSYAELLDRILEAGLRRQDLH